MVPRDGPTTHIAEAVPVGAGNPELLLALIDPGRLIGLQRNEVPPTGFEPVLPA